MPDRTDPPQTPPPVSVTVGVPSSGPGGVERRAEMQAPVNPQPTTQVVLSPQPTAWDPIPGAKATTKVLVTVGIIGLFAILYVAQTLTGMGRDKDREEYQRGRDAEDRLFWRDAMDRGDKRNEQLASEIRSVGMKLDQVSQSMSSAGNEVRTSRITMERFAKDLEDGLNRLFAELKRLVPARKPPPMDPKDVGGFISPILGLFDHDPPKVMPGAPAIAPPPRPCETQSQGGAR